MLISFDILLEWREHFKLGHPISNVIMANLAFLNQKLEQVHFATAMYSKASRFASAKHKLPYHPVLSRPCFIYYIKQSDLIFLIIVQMVLRFFLFLCLLTLSHSLIKSHRISNAELDYIGTLSYQGFYCFEAIATRNLHDVICGICGTVAEVYLGDGDEKNCCNNSRARICIIYILFKLLNCLCLFTKILLFFHGILGS